MSVLKQLANSQRVMEQGRVVQRRLDVRVINTRIRELRAKDPSDIRIAELESVMTTIQTSRAEVVSRIC